ncbi:MULTISPECIES: sulfite exporter TauE/SafE family protein [Brucella/Ochrobactrum group]|nr:MULTISPECIES: sulfite exporter TauE/SafE family protein [Brucella/Ochrobactrum group]RNL46440.1 sulfite exporter TauE/SafE family protein [Ochrobactrum sp. MH181795]AIK41797.1 sulfite exporter TauE/SafE family protein [Brucella anthropi]KAB2706364.1 sulfite exporter TauE/SafE family protein [Brucella lupini]KAB2725746.1 sulfite exporter TauE/SafE family protein [Brucella anthropi]KAB2742331.1 sulfite exporter TauE/SafE family protein [Brucella anthropi]
MLEHTPLFLAIAVIAAFLVGLSKGGLPSVGTLAVPLMALVISPVTAAALLLPIYVISDMFGLYLYRHHFSARNLAILTPAAILGVGVGWMFSAHLSPTFIGMLVGLVGILFCFNAWFGALYRKSARKADVPGGVFWGVLTGLTSFVSHSGAPPFQMYVLPQHLPKLVFAGTSTILFAIVNAVKLVPYWQLQQFSNLDTSLGLWLVPAAVIGTFVGAKLTRIMPDGPFFLLVQLTLFGLSIKLIADWIVPYFFG